MEDKFQTFICKLDTSLHNISYQTFSSLRFARDTLHGTDASKSSFPEGTLTVWGPRVYWFKYLHECGVYCNNVYCTCLNGPHDARLVTLDRGAAKQRSGIALELSSRKKLWSDWISSSDIHFSYSGEETSMMTLIGSACHSSVQPRGLSMKALEVIWRLLKNIISRYQHAHKTRLADRSAASRLRGLTTRV